MWCAAQDIINITIDEVQHYAKILIADALEKLKTSADQVTTGLASEKEIRDYYRWVDNVAFGVNSNKYFRFETSSSTQ